MYDPSTQPFNQPPAPPPAGWQPPAAASPQPPTEVKKPSNLIFLLPALLFIVGLVGGILLILNFNSSWDKQIQFNSATSGIYIQEPGNYTIYHSSYLYSDGSSATSFVFTNRDTQEDIYSVPSYSVSNITINDLQYTALATVYFNDAGQYAVSANTPFISSWGDSYAIMPGSPGAIMASLVIGILMIVFLTIGAVISLVVILVSRSSRKRRAQQPFMMPPVYYPQPPVWPTYPNRPVYPAPPPAYPPYQPPQPQPMYQPQQPFTPPAPPVPPVPPQPPAQPPVSPPDTSQPDAPPDADQNGSQP